MDEREALTPHGRWPVFFARRSVYEMPRCLHSLALFVAVALASRAVPAEAADVYHDVEEFSTSRFWFKAYFPSTMYALTPPQVADAGMAGAHGPGGHYIGRRNGTQRAGAVQHVYGSFVDASSECISMTATLWRYSYSAFEENCNLTSTGVISATTSIDTCGSAGHIGADFYYRIVDLALSFATETGTAGFKAYSWAVLVRVNGDTNLEDTGGGCFVIKWEL